MSHLAQPEVHIPEELLKPSPAPRGTHVFFDHQRVAQGSVGCVGSLLLRGAGSVGHPRHEISARVVEKAPDVTRLLNRLAAAGYVKRARSSEDGRESVARITDKDLAPPALKA
ncbi:MAG TPA: MarR family winged helix-turn-helix transcriptional regulator [Candidatus Acidoferrum sp.]|nr:MarR family winged helix-turn-helix transcriptional regulator [Candidatus Acidoferrum sp.]